MIHIETSEYHWNGPIQNLPGFDKKYKNIVDYILTITDEIWEQKDISLIYDTYDENIVIHHGAAITKGVQTVIDGTIKMLASFPDRKMHGEAVIWSADERGHFYSSHRIASTATNKGDTAFGKATGKQIFFRTIADCAIANNEIYEEWLVRDNLAIVEQLGFDPVEMAKRNRDYSGKKSLAYGVRPKQLNGHQSQYDQSKDEELILSLFLHAWKERSEEEICRHYTPDSVIHSIQNKDHTAATNAAFVLSLLNSFPDAVISVERLTSNKGKNRTEVAARWLLTGTHSGSGFFAGASGVPVMAIGISHFILKGGLITEEWTILDAFDVLCQIHADTGGDIPLTESEMSVE
jgi:predicted ester cyclase